MAVLYPNEVTYFDVKYALRQDRGPESFIQSTIEVLKDKKLYRGGPASFTSEDVSWVRSKATANFVKIPYRCRMRGMVVDLNVHEVRALCFMDAVIELLSQKNLVDQGEIMGPVVYTEVQEVISEQTYGATFTPQKK